MKKMILVFLLIFMPAINAFASNDFRNFNWGVSINEIKNNEKSSFIDSKFHSNTSQLIYKDKLLGNECFILYIFIDNKLISGEYIFNGLGESTRFMLFDRLVGHFDTKYTPVNKENNKSQHGFKAAYKSNTTKIEMLNENGKLTVIYMPLDLSSEKENNDLSFF